DRDKTTRTHAADSYGTAWRNTSDIVDIRQHHLVHVIDRCGATVDTVGVDAIDRLVRSEGARKGGPQAHHSVNAVHEEKTPAVRWRGAGLWPPVRRRLRRNRSPGAIPPKVRRWRWCVHCMAGCPGTGPPVGGAPSADRAACGQRTPSARDRSRGLMLPFAGY